jgi:hypothetical protein
LPCLASPNALLRLPPSRSSLPDRVSDRDRQIEQIGMMPRAKQKFITEMLEALIKQQQAS